MKAAIVKGQGDVECGRGVGEVVLLGRAGQERVSLRADM